MSVTTTLPPLFIGGFDLLEDRTSTWSGCPGGPSVACSRALSSACTRASSSQCLSAFLFEVQKQETKKHSQNPCLRTKSKKNPTKSPLEKKTFNRKKKKHVSWKSRWPSPRRVPSRRPSSWKSSPLPTVNIGDQIYPPPYRGPQSRAPPRPASATVPVRRGDGDSGPHGGAPPPHV